MTQPARALRSSLTGSMHELVYTGENLAEQVRMDREQHHRHRTVSPVHDMPLRRLNKLALAYTLLYTNANANAILFRVPHYRGYCSCELRGRDGQSGYVRRFRGEEFRGNNCFFFSRGLFVMSLLERKPSFFLSCREHDFPLFSRTSAGKFTFSHVSTCIFCVSLKSFLKIGDDYYI